MIADWNMRADQTKDDDYDKSVTAAGLFEDQFLITLPEMAEKQMARKDGDDVSICSTALA